MFIVGICTGNVVTGDVLNHEDFQDDNYNDRSYSVTKVEKKDACSDMPPLQIDPQILQREIGQELLRREQRQVVEDLHDWAQQNFEEVHKNAIQKSCGKSKNMSSLRYSDRS